MLSGSPLSSIFQGKVRAIDQGWTCVAFARLVLSPANLFAVGEKLLSVLPYRPNTKFSLFLVCELAAASKRSSVPVCWALLSLVAARLIFDENCAFPFVDLLSILEVSHALYLP